MRMHTVPVAVMISAAFALWHGSLHAAPPEPPAGFKWEVNGAFTDEFSGERLDTAKWYDYHPRWKGRPPAKFMRDAVSVKDGKLRIKNRVLKPAQGRFTIAGGAVVSRSEQAHYGYYEIRMKASGISMSSTFWFSNRSKKIDGASISQELDVQEAVGGGKRQPKRRHYMKSNTHYWVRDKKGKQDLAAHGEAGIKPAVDEAYHVYGVWWIDATTLKFYHNDVYRFTIHPSTRHDKTPFDRPMHMNLVTETYNWETPPTPEELGDDSKNTTYYDWVRSYKLVRVDEKKEDKQP